MDREIAAVLDVWPLILDSFSWRSLSEPFVQLPSSLPQLFVSLLPLFAWRFVVDSGNLRIDV